MFGVINCALCLRLAPVVPPRRQDVAAHRAIYENGLCILTPGSSQVDCIDPGRRSQIRIDKDETKHFVRRRRGRGDIGVLLRVQGAVVKYR